MKYLFRIVCAVCLFAGCSNGGKDGMDDLVDRSLERAIVQSKLMASDLISKPGLLPRTIDKEGKLETSTSRWWCSGFFPGVLWYLYEVSSDDSLKKLCTRIY